MGNIFSQSLEQQELLAGTYSVPSARDRIKDDFTFVPNYRSYWWNTSQSPKPAEPAKVADVARGAYSTMSDWVIPQYKERSARGEIFNNPLWKTEASLEVIGEQGCAFTARVGSVTYYGDILGVVLPVTPDNYDGIRDYAITSCDSTLGLSVDRETLIALCSTEARSRIAPPDFSGLVTLGEMRETLRFLKNPFENGIALARKLDKEVGHALSSGATVKELLSSYLGFRYGLRPLVREVENALENTLNFVEPPKRKTARAKQRQFVDGFQTTKDYVDANGLKYDVELYGYRELTVRCGFLTAYEFATGFPTQWGMRLSDIPASLWELLPLSFVYDWVANIGKFVSAVSPVMGVRTLSEWTTITDDRTVFLSGKNYRLNASGWTTTRSGNNEIRVRYLSRQRIPHVNLPSIEWSGFDRLANDALKVMDLIGIFNQKLRNAAGVEQKLLNDTRSEAATKFREEKGLTGSLPRFQKNWRLPR